MPRTRPGTDSAPEQLLPALREFAEQLKAKFAAPSTGDPEDQLRAPVERFFAAYGQAIATPIVLKGESRLGERLGRLDFAAHVGNLLTGHVELKAPGKGADPDRFKGHDRDQWERFKDLPNLIYTDGNEWALYQSGTLEGQRVRLQGDVCVEGAAAVTRENARDLFQLLAAFSSWTPIVPSKPKELAEFLAPYCHLLREDVLDALKAPQSSLHRLKDEVKQLLFPEATDRQFADNYAQTVIFALLLAHLEGADVLDLGSAYEKLAAYHLLLSRSLEFLTRDQPQEELHNSLSLAQRVIHEVRQDSLLAADHAAPDDAEPSPWLFFYEHFLAKYDPALRKAWGVYYTPVEVVRCQVRLIDEILGEHMGREMGFVEPHIFTLDPALGTGTYLLTVFDHALGRVKRTEGPGAVRLSAHALVNNLYGFEWMVGPYAVAQLRFVRAITARKVTAPPTGLGIHLTNTLESPHLKPPAPPMFHQPIADEHESALYIKDKQPVLICLGNPPYGRHEAADPENRAVTGGWVRYGDVGQRPILQDFLEPARKAGFGVHLKNLYNQYVYFIRWALWKVFEQKHSRYRWPGSGIVSFITCSSYLDGDAFVGLREHMRRVCERIDIIDLGGEGRGTRKDENVFAIQTPVAIFVAWRKTWKDGKDRDVPATVRYTRIEGSREKKLKALDAVRSHKDIKWQECPSYWQAPFKPAPRGTFTRWPLLADVFPWQNNGVKAGRTWVVDPTESGLKQKLERLFSAEASEQAKLFKNSPTGRKFGEAATQLAPSHEPLPALTQEKDADAVPLVRYAYRSFDRQHLVADARFLDRPSPCLWHAHGQGQIYLAGLLYTPLGRGPALTAAAHIPDLHFFCNRGAKDIFPLYRDSEAMQPNILPGLLPWLSEQYGRKITPEDFAGYVYALLAQPEYTSRFARQLGGCEVRVPLTKSAKLFVKAAEFGKRLLWLHTYGERLTGHGRPAGKTPAGRAKCLAAVPDGEGQYPDEFRYEEASKTLFVGQGSFGPVKPEIFEFEVSGLKVVKSWLGYRMRKRSGKKSSLLDDIRPRTWTREFTRELLELLWVLEETVEGYPAQQKLLQDALKGSLFTADDLPPVPKEARQAPKTMRPTDPRQNHLAFG